MFLQLQAHIRSHKLAKGRFLKGDDLEDLLAAAHIDRERMSDLGLAYVKRKLGFRNHLFYYE